MVDEEASLVEDCGCDATAHSSRRSLAKRVSHQIFLYRSVGLLISGVVAVAGTLALARPPLSGAAPDMVVSGATSSSAYLFKRTFSSAGAVEDGRFAFEHLGLELETNETYHDDGSACASRNVLRALGDWELHYFESHVTPDSARSVDDWMTYLATLHASLGRDDFLEKWDAFSANVVTFFSPDASPFVARLARSGVDTLKLKSYDDAGRNVYSVYAAAPRSGHLLCVAGARLSDESHVDAFRDLSAAPDAACPESLRLPFNVSALEATWTSEGGQPENARGLPDLLAVATSISVSELQSSAAFLRDLTLMGGELDTTLRSYSAKCDAQDVYLPYRGQASALVGETTTDYDLVVRYVANRGAFQTTFGIQDLETDVQEEHHAAVKLNKGWDRWLDAHLGIQVPTTSLDKVGAKLEALDRPYKAHLNSAAAEAGSLWTSGATHSSVGVELKGTFDFEFFAQANLTTLDYCAANSDGVATTSQTGRVA